MIADVFFHEYFWLSFFPISFLGVAFWLLFFEREMHQRDPIILSVLALVAGMVSAFVFAYVGEKIGIQNFFAKVAGEEFAKMVFAIIAMEILKRRFHSVASGVVYGFCVGLGFALTENLVYLANTYEVSEFSPAFWLIFQGRFWTSTLLHGTTTATFGLFYAGAYLAKTVYKSAHESPLHALFTPFNKENFWQIITFHVAREHLFFANKPTLQGHSARGVIFEGFLIAIGMHLFFNLSLDFGLLSTLFSETARESTRSSYPEVAFLIAMGGMWFLRKKVAIVS